jgi:hypothetical protein
MDSSLPDSHSLASMGSLDTVSSDSSRMGSSTATKAITPADSARKKPA